MNLDPHYQDGLLVVNTVSSGWTAIKLSHIVAWHWDEDTIDIHIVSGTIFTVHADDRNESACADGFLEWSGVDQNRRGWR